MSVIDDIMSDFSKNKKKKKTSFKFGNNWTSTENLENISVLGYVWHSTHHPPGKFQCESY